MTKIREPLTIEKILQDVIGKLKENEIKEFTGKSISHFRKAVIQKIRITTFIYLMQLN